MKMYPKDLSFRNIQTRNSFQGQGDHYTRTITNSIPPGQPRFHHHQFDRLVVPPFDNSRLPWVPPPTNLPPWQNPWFWHFSRMNLTHPQV